MASGYLVLITWQLRLLSVQTRWEEGDLPGTGCIFPKRDPFAFKHHPEKFFQQPSQPTIFAEKQTRRFFLRECGCHHAC